MACSVPFALELDAQVVVRGDVVHTVSGDPIEKGAVVVRDGRIAWVGPAADVDVPAGFREMRAAVVTPGLVDGRSVVGLAGWLNQEQDQDQVDRGSPVQPELRAIDGFNRRDRLVTWLRDLGVTTVHTGHAPAALVSGQTMVVKTGGVAERAVLDPEAMVACAIGSAALSSEGKPGTRAKAVALLRQALLDAKAYRQRVVDGKDPEPDLQKQIWGRVLEGEVPLLVHAHRVQDLRAALRLRQEFGLRLVLDGAAEAYDLLDDIREAGVPVIAHAPMLRARGDAANATFALGARLHAAGIPFAYQSGYETYVPKTRVVLFEAAVGAAHGLPRDAALRSITLGAAEILGVAERIGSLEVGKDGDLALFDGDPFETATHCVGVVIGGEVVSDAPR